MKEASDKHIMYEFIYLKCLEQANPWREKVDQWLPGSGERGGQEWRVTASRFGGSLWDDENVLNLDCGGIYTAL